MTAIVGNLRILRHSFVCAFADYAMMFTWRTWTTAYLGRMVMQVLFFGIIGLLLDDPAAIASLIIGNAVVIAAFESVNAINSTTWERRAGTLSLLVASPSNPLTVLAGRSVQWIPTGIALSTISLVVVAQIFGIALPWPRTLLVPILVGTISLSAFAWGLLFGVLVFHAIEQRLIFTNLSYLTFMAFCGVNVPIAFWPAWLQTIVAFLPVTHGLQAIRVLLEGGAAGEIVRLAGLELAVGALWFIPAVIAIRRLVDGGRRRGTIDFSE